jgi:hypothetical protein
VRLVSRSLERSQGACETLAKVVEASRLTAHESTSESGMKAACAGVDLVVAAGSAKTQLISAHQLAAISSLRLAIDLNAVAPLGIEGIEVMDKGRDQGGLLVYGAVGVGGSKMKIHHAAIQRLYVKNDQLLDTASIFELGQSLA